MAGGAHALRGHGVKTKWQKNGRATADDMQSEKVYTGTIHNRANQKSAALKSFEHGAFRVQKEADL